MDWQPGDLALCIKMGPWRRRHSDGRFSHGCGPPAGSVLTVRQVLLGVYDEIVLRFADYADNPVSGWRGWHASRFRKITPGTDIEGIEEPRRIPVEA